MFLNIDKQNREKTALVDNNGYRISYGDLAEAMDLVGKQAAPRSLVFMLCSNTAGSVAGYLGFVDNDIVPVTLSSKINPERLTELLDIYKPGYIWLPTEKSDEILELLGDGAASHFNLYDYTLIKTGNEAYPLHDELQLCMTTSGTTGSPKLVRYKKGNLEANAKNASIAFGWTSEERPLCDLGMHYTMGLNVINAHLYVGATLLLTTYNIMSGDFWNYLKTEEATNFTGVPFSYELFTRLRFERMDLPHLKTLSQGGGRMTDENFARLAKYAEDNGKRFIASFGTTETSARAACLPPELATSKTGSIGRALPECELYLIDEAGKVITDANVEGELCIKGPNVTMGYATCAEDLLRGDDFCGVYKTGDLARFDEDGCFYITGRSSRFLKLLGYRVSLDETERLIKNKFSIDCACTGTDKQMLIYITDETKAADVVAYMTEQTNLFKNQFKAIAVPEIFRNESGKVNYKLMDSEYSNK